MVAELDEKTLTIAKSEGSFRKITIDELNELGYEISGRQLPMGNKPIIYGIFEIKNEDNKHELSFCYLYSIVEQTGVILPNTYNWYVKKMGR